MFVWLLLDCAVFCIGVRELYSTLHVCCISLQRSFTSMSAVFFSTVLICTVFHDPLYASLVHTYRYPKADPSLHPVPHVISKIESVEALVNFDAILEVRFLVLY